MKEREVGVEVNCDLGEGESPERTAALMARVDSANIACGGHAGDDDTQRVCLELAARLGVRAGAHPGWPDRAGFGRVEGVEVTPGLLAGLLDEQVGRLLGHAREAGVVLHHVKLHGALYHAVEGSVELARAYVDWVGTRHPGLRVYARAGGAVEEAGRAAGPVPEVWAEGFLDRGYRPDGTLVPRGQPGAMVETAESVRTRWLGWIQRGGVESVDGLWVPLPVRTLCVHGDGPRSLEWLDVIRAMRDGP